MIRHIVFWKLKPEADGYSADANAKRIVDALRGLTKTVPGILELKAGQDFIRAETSWDVCLETSFADRASLDAYQIHPEHLKVVALVKAVVSARAAVDFEV